MSTLSDKELKKKATRKRKQRELIPPKTKKRKSENITAETTDTNDIVLENSADYVDIYTNDAATNTEIYVCDITTQTVPDKLAVAGRIDNVLLKNELNLMKNSENLSMYRSQNSMDMNVILKSEKNTKYFIGLTPKHFLSLYKFLGDAKFSLSYWKNTKKKDFTGRNSTLSVATVYHFIAVTTWLQHFYIGSFLPSQRIYDSYNFYNMDNVFVQTFPDYEVHNFPGTTSAQEDSAKGFSTFQEYPCKY